MSLAIQLLHQIAGQSLDDNERARLRCRLAKHLEEAGDYGGARRAMGELWSRVGERPALDTLDQATAAEVLLRAGVLTGWIGSVKQIVTAQETAKNLISESLTIFEALPNEKKVAEAQTEIAYCYWREGAFDEARVMLSEALSHLEETDTELRAVALLRSAIIETSARKFYDTLRIHTDAAPLFQQIDNHSLKGRYHASFALTMRKLAEQGQGEEYIDRALIEYTAASFHYEQAGHTRYQACTENNLGFLFHTVGKFAEAHEHLDRAQALLTSLKDSVHLAQVDETRARVLLAEGRLSDAEKLVRSAVRTLEQGDEQSLLAEALTTHGAALARLGHHQRARFTLQRAVEAARQIGDSESAGHATLVIIEELGEQLPHDDLCATYGHATELLGSSRNTATLLRLSVCARRVLFLTHALPTPPDWTGFSFKNAVRRYEAHLIERALKDAGGLVSRAAQLLGFKHHHNLVSMLNNRHRRLLAQRSPVVTRNRSIINQSESPAPRHGAPKEARPITILHVEDNKMLAAMMSETFESRGWRVESCADGADALRELESDAYYDLLLFDNELPGMNGLELIRRARQLPLRRQTPIIMLSASWVEPEARRAGADEFLRKPEDVSALIKTIERLLTIEVGKR